MTKTLPLAEGNKDILKQTDEFARLNKERLFCFQNELVGLKELSIFKATAGL